MSKALLKGCKNPPDLEAAAIEVVLQQKEMIGAERAREDLDNLIQAVLVNALATTLPMLAKPMPA